MLRRIRIVVAVLSILAVTALFVDFTGMASRMWGWMASIQFIPAVLALNVAVVLGLIVATLVFGRLYCSVVCPLGIFQDAAARMGILFSSKSKRRAGRYGYRSPHTVARIVALVAFVVLAVAGLMSVAALIAPYSAYGRMVTELVRPVYVWVNNLLADRAAANDSYAFYHVDQLAVSGVLMSVAVVTLIVVGVWAWRSGRGYCNTVCPVGTVLGFFSRFALLRPVIDLSKCNGCGRCARHCKASCINPKAHEIDYSRCVACMDCMEKCSTGALRYTLAYKKEQAASESKPVDSARRNFMAAGAAVAGTAVAQAQGKLVDGGLAVIEDKQAPERLTPIVPPGAGSVAHFHQHCVACQLCVTACPNGVLTPSLSLDGFMQPRVGYENGYCRPECVKCSEVCPAGAILPLTVADKSSVSVGHAVVNIDACLYASGDAKCGNCSRHCPVGAITMVDVTEGDSTRKMPVVNSDCIGCGACENLCPVRPVSAIHVEGREIHISL